MLEHGIYSVISPEACSSILWRSTDEAKTAAQSLRLTAQEILEFGVIDEIVGEPVGGAHRDPEQAIDAVGDAMQKALSALIGRESTWLRTHRADKFLAIGRVGA
jgi:acetyl-CoA carboxylase carboxyl transferase subunit alpha